VQQEVGIMHDKIELLMQRARNQDRLLEQLSAQLDEIRTGNRDLSELARKVGELTLAVDGLKDWVRTSHDPFAGLPER